MLLRTTIFIYIYFVTSIKQKNMKPIWKDIKMNRGRRAIEFIENQKQRISTFSKRKNGLINKARELSVLCGVKACMIINGPKAINVSANEELDLVWSSDSDATTIRDLIKKYKDESTEESGRRKRVFSVLDYYTDRKRKAENELANLRNKKFESKFPTWHPKLKDFKEDELRNLGGYLEGKLQILKDRRDLIKNTKTNYTVIGGSNIWYGPSSLSQVHQQQQFLHTNGYRNATKRMRMSMDSFENNSSIYNTQSIGMMEPTVMNPMTSIENNCNNNYQNRVTMAMNSFENITSYNPRLIGMMESNVMNTVTSFGNNSNHNSQDPMTMNMNSYGSNNNYYPQNLMTMPTNSCDIQPIAMIKPGANQMMQPMFHQNTSNNLQPQSYYHQMPLLNHPAQEEANMFYDPDLFDYPEFDSSPMKQSYGSGSQLQNCFAMQSVYDPSPPLLLEYSTHPEVPCHRQSSQQLDFCYNFN